MTRKDIITSSPHDKVKMKTPVNACWSKNYDWNDPELKRRRNGYDAFHGGIG